MEVVGRIGLALLVLVGAGVVSGWRPGRGRPRTEDTVIREVRARLALTDQDWRRVRMAVYRGRAAPAPLRPAAYELATELAGHHRRTPRASPARIAGTAYLALVALWLLVLGPGWSVLFRPLPPLVLGVVVMRVAAWQQGRVRAAVELNRP